MGDIKPALTNLRGPAARIASVMAETLPAGSAATVEMTGPDQNRQFKFGLPVGLPAPDALPADSAVSTYMSSPAAESYAKLRDLTQQRTGVVSASDFGVVMDGVTDDTAAWQGLFDTVPRGTVVMLPFNPDEAPAWSLISDTIQITTDSIRVVGPTSYMYNGGFVFTGISKPMFQVKAGGVQFEYFSVTGRSPFGADPTYGNQVGIEWFGAVAGDIDGRMSHCSFLGIGTAVITRGRNLTVEQTLFGECATAWEQLPKDPAYHTMTEPNIIRGLISRGNRFHAVGVTDTSPVISIHDHTDYRHGVVENNYYDNNCMGLSVKAIGTSTNPVRGLKLSGNTIQEATAGAYRLEYCDTPQITGLLFSGTGSASYTFDAITAVNCPSLSITASGISRVGRHGIVLTGCSDVEITGTRMSLVGVAATGDGLNVDATTTRLFVDAFAVDGATGYGVNGSPTSSAIGTCRIRATAGAVNSTSLSMPYTTLPGSSLIPTIGTPAVAVNNNYPVMMFDAAVSEGAGGWLNPPEGATLVAVEVVICTTTAGTGGVVIQLSRVIPESSMTDQAANATVTIPVSGAGGVFRARAHITTPANRGPLGVRLARIATDPGDTYAYDVGVLALNLVQTQ